MGGSQNGGFGGGPGGVPGPGSATLARFFGVFRGAGGLLINVFFGQVLVCFFVRGNSVCARVRGVCARCRAEFRGCARGRESFWKED